ncbi:MAG: hypothetical protein H0V17_34905, partial [Deltaproteobacteria bacterium]|nr:hypothetical protein [Deltaproteobacteria bacterium]
MHAASRRTMKRVPTRAIWLAAVCIALFIHGTVLGAAEGIGLGSVGEFTATTEPQVEDEYVDLETSCTGDVLLATSARAAMCLAPWNRGSTECANIDDLEMIMWMDLSSCRGRDQSIAPVAMATIQPRELEKVTPIDAEALLEQLDKSQPPPPPPPPVPQLQPQQQPPPPPPAPPPPKRPQQIVETAKPNTDKEPDNARFLAEHNTNVEKQKVARGARNEPMIAKSKPEELTPKDKPKDEPPAIAKKP